MKHRIAHCPWPYAIFVALSALQCGKDDPKDSLQCAPQRAAIDGSLCEVEPSYTEDGATCTPAADDYMPRVNESADDTWASCVSDNGAYQRFQESVSSISRAETYTQMGQLLWAKPTPPNHNDFALAKTLFSKGEGLGSRISRRYDPHYEEPPIPCTDTEQNAAALFPDYCVGPATLQPILNDAFAEGICGTDPVVNAARIHAALQWFLYVSAYKEATTCATHANDCDSAWAYYAGGGQRDDPAGLASEFDSVAPDTHDRAYDGVLAVRCWRDLDSAEPATDEGMQQRALSQFDKALLHGMALIVRQRFARLRCATGDYAKAELAALKILVPLLNRETKERSADLSVLLETAISRPPQDIDITSVLNAIDATYPCP